MAPVGQTVPGSGFPPLDVGRGPNQGVLKRRIRIVQGEDVVADAAPLLFLVDTLPPAGAYPDRALFVLHDGNGNPIIYQLVSGVYVTVQGEEALAQAERVDFTTNGTVIYRGEAAPGTAESASAWRIRRITLAADDDATTVWADGNSDYDNVWSNRLILSYS